MSLTEALLPPGTPLADYLAVPAMNSSGLKEFRRSPAHYRHAADNPDHGDTDATRFGTAVHAALLEPELFLQYTVLGDCHGAFKDGRPCPHPAKLARNGEGWCGKHDPDKGASPDRGPVIGVADYVRVEAIRASVAAHEVATGLLHGHAGTVEVSGVFRDTETGVWCKIRPDRVVDLPWGQKVCVDLKTTRKDTDGRWWRELASMGYHHQAALCRRGLARLGQVCTASVIVAVESAPPHGVGCYLLDEDDVARAHREISQLLARYAECLERGEWPNRPVELHERRLPEWAFNG